MKSLKSRVIGSIAAAGLAALVGCSTIPQKPEIVPKEGMKNTLTYVENEKKVTVYDLSGVWDAVYEMSGKQILQIQQKKNYFEAIKMVGSQYVPAGVISIKGFISNDLINAQSLWSTGEWKLYYGRIENEGDHFCLLGETTNCFWRRK